jgi:hypothetical protein
MNMNQITQSTLTPNYDELLTGCSKYHPYLYRLKTINWFIFGTLTWEFESRRRHSHKAEWFRKMDFIGLITTFCSLYKIRKKSLAYYQATEFGKCSELHYHFLVAASGLEHLSASECALTLENQWKCNLKPYGAERTGVGMANVKAYDEAREHPAVEYCLKREFNPSGGEWERYDFLSPRLLKIAMIEKPPKKQYFNFVAIDEAPDEECALSF